MPQMVGESNPPNADASRQRPQNESRAQGFLSARRRVYRGPPPIELKKSEEGTHR
jgi:hypothetical protein